MIKKVTFNKGGSGGHAGRVILPLAYLELMKITKDEPEVELTYEDGKIVIQKAEKRSEDIN